MQISKHFSLSEFTRSDYARRHGIDNTPNADVLENLRMLAARIDRLRDVLSLPIHVTSGYRSPKLNAGIGGSKSSRHMVGLAADIECPRFGTAKDLFDEMRKHKDMLDWDQLILEYPPNGWVHFGICGEDEFPRGDVLVFNGKSYERLT
jgi:hypothetical protein